MKWLKALAGGVKGIVLGGGGDALGKTLAQVEKFVPDGDARSATRAQVITEWVQAQAQVQVAQMQYGTWLTRSWRPILFLSFGLTLLWNYAIGRMCGFPPLDLPNEFWSALEMGLGMGIGGRSVEKITGMIAPGRKMRKMVKEMKDNG